MEIHIKFSGNIFVERYYIKCNIPYQFIYSFIYISVIHFHSIHSSFIFIFIYQKIDHFSVHLFISFLTLISVIFQFMFSSEQFKADYLALVSTPWGTLSSWSFKYKEITKPQHFLWDFLKYKKSRVIHWMDNLGLLATSLQALDGLAA